MSVNIKVTGGFNIEWGQIDPKVTGGLRNIKIYPSLYFIPSKNIDISQERTGVRSVYMFQLYLPVDKHKPACDTHTHTHTHTQRETHVPPS